MKKQLFFILAFLLTLTIQAQEKYGFKPNLPPITLAELLKHNDTLFFSKTDFTYNCTTSYLLPYNKINVEPDRKPGYVEEQLKSIEKDSMSPYAYSNLAFYYENRGEGELARKNYEKALQKIPFLKKDKDEAKYYSYTSITKFHLGQDGTADMEKALSINKNDSLAMAFYPMYLLNNQDFKGAIKVLANTLDNKETKYNSYMMLYMAECFGAMSRSMADGSDMEAFVAKINMRNFINMEPYQKYFKKNDAYFELEKEMIEMFGVTFKAIYMLKNKEQNFSADDLAYIDRKEKFFNSRLKEKEANRFGLYMALSVTSITKKDFKGAIDYYKKAAADFPQEKEGMFFNLLDTYRNMAFLQIYLKDYDSAMATLKTALNLKIVTPANKASIVLNMGKLYFMKKDFENAVDYGKQSLAIEDNFDVNLFLSYMYAMQDLNTISHRYADKAESLVQTKEQLCSMLTYNTIWGILNSQFDLVVGTYQKNKDKLEGECKSCDYIIQHYIAETK